MRTSSMHPQAKFDPIPPDLDLHALVENTQGFDWVRRISVAQIRNIGQREFERLVLLHVVEGGKPLVIEKWNERLSKPLFSAQWLERTYNKKQESVRDIGAQKDIPMTMGHYLRSMKQLTDQWNPTNFRDERRQRLYLKDIDCPPEWHDGLRALLPPNLFYLNENVEQRGNRREEDMDIYHEGRVTAPAGDLMSSLPPEMRAQNLMCYIGHEGTYTPAHKEMCASLGQNIMVDASGETGGEKPGSSVWFMTETKDREVVREYFLSMLGHDIEIEKHFAQVNAWKKATFPVYVVEQKVGDFILVPPLAAHQVWNRGTRTVKVAWNRTTAESLRMALHEALPKARLVCRDEQYKNKAIIYFTLRRYYQELLSLQETAETAWFGLGEDLFRDSPRMQQLAGDFKSLFALFSEILVSEMFSSQEKDVEYIEFDSNITCSYCRANIFNRFLTCKHCVRQMADGDEDTYDVCMECYAMGRSCVCISGLSWCEQWKWWELVENYELWRSMVIRNDGFVDLDSSPMPLEIARRKPGKKSVAQVCQEQLRMRPFNDITRRDVLPEPEESEPEADADGQLARKKSRRRKKKGDIYRCHVCFHKDYRHKLAFCSTPDCAEAYCYGVLYRAFDLMPQTAMEDERWKCPKCMGICNCGACRRMRLGNPYLPRNTSLGHDTRRVADDRSVESLVDFRLHNLGWLKNAGDESRNLESKRMQRLRQAAEAEKAKVDGLASSISLPPGDEDAGSHDAMQRTATSGHWVPGQPGAMGEDGTALPVAEPQSELLQEEAANGHPLGPAAVAGIPLAEDESFADFSSYPDPSVLAHEPMIGMGYYQQDDSPDKILFDPYQTPSAAAMAGQDDEREVSEYVRKSLRAAKRRVRQEGDDDPDFAVPRSLQRKRPKVDDNVQHDAQQEALDNMDPALFAQDSAMSDSSGMDQDPAAGAGNAGDGERAEDAVPEQGDKLRHASPLRPSPRRSRPKMPYAEIDDGGEGDLNVAEDDLNEAMSVDDQHTPSEPAIAGLDPQPLESSSLESAENETRDSLDLASAAVEAMGRTVDGPELTAAPPAPAPAGPRKRGRPAREPHTPAEGILHPTGRRLGRPPRSRLSSGSNDPADAEVEDRQATAEPATAEPDTLASASVSSGGNGEQIQQPEKTPAPRKRGLPRKSGRQKAVRVNLQTSHRGSPPPDMRFLSLKERMALKGKNFKVAQRNPTRPAGPDNRHGAEASTSAAAAAAPVVGSADEGSGSQGARTRRPPPGRVSPAAPSPSRSVYAPSASRTTPHSPEPLQPAGPTIVRLGDSEDGSQTVGSGGDDDHGASDDHDGGHSSVGLTSDPDDEDGDSPARKPYRGIARRGWGTVALAPARDMRGGRGGRGGRGRGGHSKRRVRRGY